MNQGKQILIAFDQFINTLIPPWKGPHRGWADETLSSRCWRRSRYSKKWDVARKVIDWIFRVTVKEENHCFESWVSESLRMQMPPELRDLVNGEVS